MGEEESNESIANWKERDSQRPTPTYDDDDDDDDDASSSVGRTPWM